MPTQVNLGPVRGTDANVNGVTNLLVIGNNGVEVTQQGDNLVIAAPASSSHMSSTDNPHNVTKTQLGLGNVDNVSEATIIADAKTDIMTSANITTALGYTPVSPTQASGKQDKLTGTVHQTVTFDANGNAIVVDKIEDVYGFEILKNESNPASKIRYIGANAGFRSAYMNYSTGQFDYGDWADAWFIKGIKPRIMKSDGTVLEELSQTNYGKKADNTNSSVADDTVDGNVMVGIPTVWIKIEDTDESIRIHIAPYRVDPDYHAWAHTDSEGNINDYTYIAAYNGWDQYVANTTDHKLRSISGKNPTRSQTGTNQIAYCRANNQNSDTMWDMHTLSDRELIQILLMLIGKSTDSQTVFGGGNNYGYYNKATAAVIHAAIPGYPETALGCDENGVIPTGTMDTCGLFWGSNANNLGVKVFGIENLWGNIYDRTQGLVSVNGHIKAKLTRGMDDGSTVSDYNTTGAGYVEIGVPIGGTDGAEHQNNYYEGYISQMKANQYGLFMGNLSNGSASTHYCDYGYNIKNGTVFSLTGGFADGTNRNGLFVFYLVFASSVLSWYIGAPPSLWWVVFRTTVFGRAFSDTLCMLVFLPLAGVLAHIYNK